MSNTKKILTRKVKAVIYGMSWGLLISLGMGYLFDDFALGLVFGLGIGVYLTYEKA